LARWAPSRYFVEMRLFRPLRRAQRASVLGLAACAVALSAAAEPDETEPDPPPPIARGVAPREVGRPTVRLDRLEFPAGVAVGRELERHFREQLKRAARRADWGAKHGAKIEYRVKLEELSVREGDRVVHVRCTALGSLPKGRTTRTFIDFGGNPNERDKVVRHVLDIVARGVVTRLAAIERERRTQAAAN
jgi:hypothetical protein